MTDHTPQGDNLRDIRRTFALMLDPDSVAELRIPKAGRYRTISGYFDDFEKMAQEANTLSGKYAAVYFTLNPVLPALLARSANRTQPYTESTTSDAQIIRRRNLLIDADATRPGGISSTDEEHELALAKVRTIRADLTTRGWPMPLYADSGNGGHLVYRIDLSADDTRVQRALKALASEYDDDAIKIDTSVYNPARITKVYGTLTRKGDNTPTRPHRWARILEAPDVLEMVSAAQVDALLADLEPKPAEAKPASTSLKLIWNEAFDLDIWMQRYAPDATGPEPWEDGGRIWTFEVCPWRPDDTGDTAFVAQLPSGAISAGCQHATCPGSKATGNHWKELRALREPAYVDRSDEWKPIEQGAQPTAKIKTPPYTDLGNAERFVAQHAERARYCHSAGAWYVWDKRRWERDATAEVMRMAHKTVRAMEDEVENCKTEKAEAALRAWIKASESNNRLNAMLTQAGAVLPVPVTLGELDADPWLLNVQNGIVDLRTGRLMPHDPAKLLTKLAPVNYDPAARSALWERFLRESTGGDDDLIAFLQRAVGYTLTGDTCEEKLFFVHGPTNSGKSTFLEALKSCLGEYSMTADFETFLARSFVGGPRPDIARLAGARFVVSIEVDEGKKLAEGLVKQITGGDTISARFLYREEFEFRPQFKLWLAANHAPEVKHDDDAMWRRILKLPFELTVPKEKRDPKLKATLADPAQSGAAILAWAVQGCLEWQRQGLAVPFRVELATEEYRRKQDPLAGFVASYCVLGDSLWAPAGELRRAYEQWARETGTQILNGIAWADALESHGCISDRRYVLSVRRRGWSGIGLVTDDEEEQQPMDF